MGQEPQYQNEEWCYQKYVVDGLSYAEIAKECGVKPRTIQKWCSEKYGLNRHTFRKHKELTERQKQIIYGGVLGDGHITTGDEHHANMYIESHAADQKEYLYWKYEELKDLCSSPPKHYDAYAEYFPTTCNTYVCQDFFRFGTRIIDALEDIRTMRIIDILDDLSRLGFVVHILDDASRSDSNWMICLAAMAAEEKDAYIHMCKTIFNLNCQLVKCDDRYCTFDADSSRIIDKMVLENVPNNIDVVRHKIIDRRITKNVTYRYVETPDGSTALAKYCKQAHLKYESAKKIYEMLDTKRLDECELLSRLGA